MPEIEISKLSKKYGDVEAVIDFNLALDDGEFFVLLGPSGAGKSSVIHMMTGLVKLDSGSIKVGGVVIASETINVTPRKRGLAAVFQEGGLWPNMTVLQHLLFVLSGTALSEAEKRKRAEKYLSLVRLDGYEGRFPHQLSGGEKQRVAIALSLVIERKYLLFDEPFANLDRPLVLDLISDISRLHRELGLTILLVTHQQEEALFLADRMGVMRKGSLVQVGKPMDIYHHPKNRFVARFFGDNNIIEGVFVSTEAVLDTVLGGFHVPGQLDSGRGWLCVRPSSITASREGDGVGCALASSVFKGDYWLGEFIFKDDSAKSVSVKVNFGSAAPEPGYYKLTITGPYTVLHNDE